MTRWHRWIGWGLALALAGGCAVARSHVEIVVEDPSGKAVPGAGVSCAAPATALPEVETDRRGRVEIPRGAGKQAVVGCEVRKSGYQRSGMVEVPADAGRVRITLHRLQPGEGDPGGP